MSQKLCSILYIKMSIKILKHWDYESKKKYFFTSCKHVNMVIIILAWWKIRIIQKKRDTSKSLLPYTSPQESEKLHIN